MEKMLIPKKIERIICGDNLEILKTIESESVDLIYIDPPFFSGKNYAVIWNDGAEIRQFEDRWVKMGNKGKMSKDINVYLDWMKPRLDEMKRILKKTGSFYLHCDWHADSYLRTMCDEIFGYNNFKSHIKWKKATGGKFSSNYWDSVDDSIFLYTKSSKYTWNIQYYPYSKDKLKKNFPLIDGKGRYKKRSLKAGGTQVSKDRRVFKYKGCKGMWVNSEKTMDVLFKNNDLIIENDTLYRKQRPRKGIKIDNFWSDIPTTLGNESLGYPTQKPEALLERIIKASSNKGDVILDAFCGCGTTLAVAQKLNRQFIGIDVSDTACRVMAERISKPTREVEGLPLNPEEIKKLSGWEFQNWINREFGAINGKRGADGGIDGTFKGILIQVKKHKVGRNNLDAFIGTLLRKDKQEGIFIGLKFTSTFIKEVSRLKRENEIKIHYFTADDILKNKHRKFITLERFTLREFFKGKEKNGKKKKE